MNQQIVMGVIMAVFGALLLGGVVFRWRWLVEGRKFRRLAASMGEQAPRILYGVMGLILIAFGVLNALGRWHGISGLGTP